MKEGRVWTFLVVALAVFLTIPLTSANFACGEVEGIGNFSSSWFDVSMYYTQNISAVTECQISPDGGKYCCDPLQIKSVAWGIGKTLNARINQNGYFAGPVNLSISGEGFDIFPKMFLRRGIEIGNFSKVNVNASGIEINVSTVLDYRNVTYALRNITNGSVLQGVLCSDCNNANLHLENFGFGQFELEVKAKNPSGSELIETKNIWNFNYISFERKIQCRKCKDNYVYSGEILNMSLKFKLSHEVDSRIQEVFPNNWVFGEGVERVSDSHNSISWNVSGRNIERNYTLRAPKTIFTKKFVFRTVFWDYAEEDPVVLYRLYKFLPYPSRFLSNHPSSNYYTEFESISPSNAAVVSLEDNLLTMIAIFPEEEVENVYVFINKNPPVKRSQSRFNFVVGSNLREDFEDMLIQYKIGKRTNRVVDNLGLYYYDEQSSIWNEIESEKYDEDEDFEYYEANYDKEGFFAVDYDYGRLDE